MLDVERDKPGNISVGAKGGKKGKIRYLGWSKTRNVTEDSFDMYYHGKLYIPIPFIIGPVI